MRRRASVVSYNILAPSLGSNTIPWVTALSRELSESVDAALGVAPVEGATTWETLLKRVITPEYRPLTTLGSSATRFRIALRARDGETRVGLAALRFFGSDAECA